jgi:transposase-like protein
MLSRRKVIVLQKEPIEAERRAAFWGCWTVTDPEIDLQSRKPSPRQQVRRRALPAERRAEFDRLLLAGEDIARLARRFGIEPWYARRRASRVLARSAEDCGHSALLAPPPAQPDTMTPSQYACSLLGQRVSALPNGYYILDSFHAGPREIMRAANRVLRDRGMPEIQYPGLRPLTR